MQCVIGFSPPWLLSPPPPAFCWWRSHVSSSPQSPPSIFSSPLLYFLHFHVLPLKLLCSASSSALSVKLITLFLQSLIKAIVHLFGFNFIFISLSLSGWNKYVPPTPTKLTRQAGPLFPSPGRVHIRPLLSSVDFLLSKNHCDESSSPHCFCSVDRSRMLLAPHIGVALSSHRTVCTHQTSCSTKVYEIQVTRFVTQ